jgi:DNA-binding response OmpR family regulator
MMLGSVLPTQNVGTVAKVNKTRRQKPRELRAYVAEMPRAEAIDHLIYLFEELTGTEDPLVGHFPDVHLSPMERRLFCVLLRNEGQLASHDSVIAALYPTTSSPPYRAVVPVMVSRMRRKLSAYVEILPSWGEGYVMRRKPNAVFPWEDAQ